VGCFAYYSVGLFSTVFLTVSEKLFAVTVSPKTALPETASTTFSISKPILFLDSF